MVAESEWLSQVTEDEGINRASVSSPGPSPPFGYRTASDENSRGKMLNNSPLELFNTYQFFLIAAPRV